MRPIRQCWIKCKQVELIPSAAPSLLPLFSLNILAVNCPAVDCDDSQKRCSVTSNNGLIYLRSCFSMLSDNVHALDPNRINITLRKLYVALMLGCRPWRSREQSCYLWGLDDVSCDEEAVALLPTGFWDLKDKIKNALVNIFQAVFTFTLMLIKIILSNINTDYFCK